MGHNSARKVLKPQPDGKQPRKKKTLREAASDIKVEIQEHVREETRRRSDERSRAEEDAVALMIFGPADADCKV